MDPIEGGPGYDTIRPRIFQIGFNKCGTRSFADYFHRNEISETHYRRGNLALAIQENYDAGQPLLTNFDRWTAYTDMQRVARTGVIEACQYYKLFASYYPRSYFILNTRSKDRWIKSRLNHGEHQNYSNRYRQGLGLETIEETIEAWSDMWDRQHRDVPEFFAETGQHFMIYNIETDTPDKLAEFLSPDFRTDPSLFGHVGKTGDVPQSDA